MFNKVQRCSTMYDNVQQKMTSLRQYFCRTQTFFLICSIAYENLRLTANNHDKSRQHMNNYDFLIRTLSHLRIRMWETSIKVHHLQGLFLIKLWKHYYENNYRDKWENNRVISDLQGACKRGQSCEQSAVLLQESYKSCLCNKLTVFNDRLLNHQSSYDVIDQLCTIVNIFLVRAVSVNTACKNEITKLYNFTVFVLNETKSFYIFKIYPKALNVYITIIISVLCGIELIQ